MLNGCLVNRHTLERTTICSTISASFFLSLSLSRKHSIRSTNATTLRGKPLVVAGLRSIYNPFVSFVVCNNGSEFISYFRFRGNSVDAFGFPIAAIISSISVTSVRCASRCIRPSVKWPERAIPFNEERIKNNADPVGSRLTTRMHACSIYARVPINGRFIALEIRGIASNAAFVIARGNELSGGRCRHRFFFFFNLKTIVINF